MTASSSGSGSPAAAARSARRSASLLTDEIKGKPVADVEAFRADDLLDLLGIDISPARLKCAMLSHETLQKALAETDGHGRGADATTVERRMQASACGCCECRRPA